MLLSRVRNTKTKKNITFWYYRNITSDVSGQWVCSSAALSKGFVDASRRHLSCFLLCLGKAKGLFWILLRLTKGGLGHLLWVSEFWLAIFKQWLFYDDAWVQLMLSAACHLKLGVRGKKDQSGRRWKEREGQVTFCLETCSLTWEGAERRWLLSDFWRLVIEDGD